MVKKQGRKTRYGLGKGDGPRAKPVKHWFASRIGPLLLALSLLLIFWVAGWRLGWKHTLAHAYSKHPHTQAHAYTFFLTLSPFLSVLVSEVVMCCSSLWGLSSTSYSCSVITHQLTSQSENINQDTLRHCCPQVSPRMMKWLFWEEMTKSSWFLQDFLWFARWQITGYFSGSCWCWKSLKMHQFYGCVKVW